MYIEPNTDIYILHNVPLDTTYDHTIWFANATDQANYFINLRKYTLSDYTYQRVKRGYMRVGINANNLYDCNYLMFRNTNFGSKWFYAYITSVEYVNNDVSEIVFEIDDMQTWFFDYSLDECFVEREHSATDVIGDNIVPEVVELGEYVRNSQGANQNSTAQGEAENSGFLYGFGRLFPSGLKMVMIQVVEVNNGANDGALVNGIFSGCKYYWFKAVTASDIAAINQFLGNYVSDPDAVVNMYMIMSDFIYGTPPLNDEYNGSSDDEQPLALMYSSAEQYAGGYSFPFPKTFSPITAGVTLDGYTPHNNKLYTYPYNFLEVNNGKGDTAVYRYEFFSDIYNVKNLTPQFMILTTVASPVQATLMPINYKGRAWGGADYEEQLVLDELPTCSWNADFYKMYMSQNFVADIVRAGSNILAGAAFGAPKLGVKNAIESVGNSVANYYTASKKADIGKGNFNNANVLWSGNVLGYYCGRMSINKNNARIIDEFFDRFGYATNLMKVPNTHARARWCYTKTVACTISGSIPADSARHICEIYNNGITFWRNGQTVCDYSNPATNIPNGEVGD